MVLWCKTCGAFIGLREPYSDWSVDRVASCEACIETLLSPDQLRAVSDSDEGPLPVAAAEQ